MKPLTNYFPPPFPLHKYHHFTYLQQRFIMRFNNSPDTSPFPLEQVKNSLDSLKPDGLSEKELPEQQPRNVVDKDVAQAHTNAHRRGHQYTPPSATDFRSPCPALNALANHHYLSHNGQSISPTQLCSALQKGYGLSWPLAVVLTYGGFYMIKQWSARTLKDFAKHNCIEHDASLIHYDTWTNKEFAPAQASTNLIENLTKTIQAHARIADPSIIADNESPTKHILDNEFFLNTDIIGYLRHKRERCSPHLDSVHAEIARGEMALVLLIFASRPRSPFEKLWIIPVFLFAMLLSMFGYNQLQLRMRENAARRVLLEENPASDGVPVEWLHTFFREERFPDGWEPKRTVGLLETIYVSSLIRKSYKKFGPIYRASFTSKTKYLMYRKSVVEPKKEVRRATMPSTIGAENSGW